MSFFPLLRAIVFPGIALLCACACATMQPVPALAPFTTDGCSMFPDRSLWSDTDWCACCVAHDLAYWRGGTAEQRLAADEALRACVLRSSGNAALAELMFSGVRAGGEPTVFTSWRWAYGWPFGRNYAALTPDEQAAAKALQAQYENSPQPRACTK